MAPGVQCVDEKLPGERLHLVEEITPVLPVSVKQHQGFPGAALFII